MRFCRDRIERQCSWMRPNGGNRLDSFFVQGHTKVEGRCLMKWITREHVKVDRVACPWLIKKFVDKDAEFVFVPTE